MRHRVCEVEEEGLISVGAHEGGGAVAEVSREAHLVGARHLRVCDLCALEGEEVWVAALALLDGVREVRVGRVPGPHVVRVGDPVGLIEAVVGGEELGLIAEVPLAEHGRRVAL